MMLREMMAVYYENRVKPISTLCGEKSEFFSTSKKTVNIVTAVLHMAKTSWYRIAYPI
jgi:hypothetical protein